MTSQDYSMQNNDALFGNPPSNPLWSVPDMPTIPESLTLAILPLLIAATIVTSLICKKKQ
jgi:cystathionine beta-lyase/cystathionine gamma-synthase